MASLPQNLAVAVERVLRSPGPNQVHDLRVAIRRFNQAVALNSQNRNKAERQQLKEAMQRAGEVRNLDITLKLVAKVKGTRGLQSKLNRRRREAAKSLADQLKASPLPQELPGPARAQPRQAAADAIARLFKRGEKAKRPKDLHRVRIAAKKLRYTLEMVAPHFPRLDEIKRLQTDLGKINDYETARALIRRESGARSVGDELKDKQQKKIRAFRSRWSGTLADGAAARKWIRELSAAAKA